MGGRGTGTRRLGTSLRTQQRNRRAAKAAADRAGNPGRGGGGGGAGEFSASQDFLANGANIEDVPAVKSYSRAYDKATAAGKDSYEAHREASAALFKELGYDQAPTVVSPQEFRRQVRLKDRLLRDINGSGDELLDKFKRDNEPRDFLRRDASPAERADFNARYSAYASKYREMAEKVVQQRGKEFLSGDAYVSTGVHGTGMGYTASGKGARPFLSTFVSADAGQVAATLRAGFLPKANIISDDVLSRQKRDYLDVVHARFNKMRSAGKADEADRIQQMTKRVLGDKGLYAALRGYDGVLIPYRIASGYYNYAENPDDYSFSNDEHLILNRKSVVVSSSTRSRFGNFLTEDVAANRRLRKMARAARRK